MQLDDILDISSDNVYCVMSCHISIYPYIQYNNKISSEKA